MSVNALICTSIVHVAGTWFAPKGTLFWSAGNENTCNIQGWSFTLFFPYASGYNAALSIVFLLSARYSWNEEYFRKWSSFILCFPPLFVTLLHIPFFRYYTYMNYNGTGWQCVFNPSPPGCSSTPGVECNEDNMKIYDYYYLTAACVLFLTCGIIIYACVRLFLVARQSDESVREYRRSDQGNYASSNRVAVRGLLFSGGNLLVVLPTFFLCIGLVADVEALFFWTFFDLLQAIFMPLQGFFQCPGIL